MVYTYTGVMDEITALTFEDEFHIQVSFKVHGFYLVSRIMNQETFESLKKMNVGQKVLVATGHGELAWVKPE